jgi:hypothetical protein
MALKVTTAFTFRRRPSAIPADLRPHWRIAVILLILSKGSRGQQASLKKLHVLNWAMKSDQARARFRDYCAGLARPDDVIIRFEPSLDRAVGFAVAEGLVQFEDGRKLSMTDRGRRLAAEIDKSDVLQQEKFFLDEVRAKATETRIESLLNWEPQ